jgi:hypothetical protein
MPRFNIDKPLTARELARMRRNTLLVQVTAAALMLAGFAGIAWSGTRPDAQKAHYAWLLIAGGGVFFVGMLLQGLGNLSIKAFTAAAEPPFSSVKHDAELHAKLEAYVAQVHEQKRPFTRFERIAVKRLLPQPRRSALEPDEAIALVVLDIVLNILSVIFG